MQTMTYYQSITLTIAKPCPIDLSANKKTAGEVGEFLILDSCTDAINRVSTFDPCTDAINRVSTFDSSNSFLEFADVQCVQLRH